MNNIVNVRTVFFIAVATVILTSFPLLAVNEKTTPDKTAIAKAAPERLVTPADLTRVRAAAERGDAKVQNNLADAYFNGEGIVTKDVAEAIKWYGKAAEQGNASAQNSLGMAYADGNGVAKNLFEAVKWWGLAAEQNNILAQYSLGSAYYYGEGVAKDYTIAVKWWRAAAEQGDALAQYSLGRAYYMGQGVSEDKVFAYVWFNLAASQGNAMYVENRDQLAAALTKEQVAEGQRLSREWMHQHLNATPTAPSPAVPAP